MTTKNYTLKFADGKRCTAIVMDASISDDQIQADMRDQFHPGYMVEATKVVISGSINDGRQRGFAAKDSSVGSEGS